MNKTLKTVLLTLLTLSVLTIAMIELTGISQSKFWRNEEKTDEQEATKKLAEKPDLPSTKVAFLSSTFDFGTIKDGDVVKHVYQFTNTGANPLIIDAVIASCGCTIPTYTKTPVAPGAKGEIAISFDSKGRIGNVDKEIYVMSNAEQNKITLNFKANVTP